MIKFMCEPFFEERRHDLETKSEVGGGHYAVGEPGDFVVCKIGEHMLGDGMLNHFPELHRGKNTYVIIDHNLSAGF